MTTTETTITSSLTSQALALASAVLLTVTVLSQRAVTAVAQSTPAARRRQAIIRRILEGQ